VAEVTKISWTRSSFNPWIGCSKVGPGCDHCYAEALDKRHRWKGATHWGAGVPRMRTSPSNWNGPLKWERAAAASGERWLVFCASLADVFDNEIPDEWRADLWRLLEKTTHLSWLLVTKRIGNVERMVPPAWIAGRFPDNVRLLITVVNQQEADRDVPKLLALPCKNGISYEPALGPVDWSPWLEKKVWRSWPIPHVGVEWIIVGGESTQGAPARPFEVEWARSTIAQCRAAGVPVFVKQLGSRPHWQDGERSVGCAMPDRAGANPAEWPEDLRVQELPA
jgi:protein gp37